MTPLAKLIPDYRTCDLFPDTQLHGAIVLAYSETHDEIVVIEPHKVRERPKEFTFWSKDRRMTTRGKAE